MWCTTRQRVATVVEADLLQALETAVVSIGLHKIEAWPLVDVAHVGINGGRLAKWMAVRKKVADARSIQLVPPGLESGC